MNILKNVFNWTVGSFFRTIGRIIAFFVIGFLIFSILQKLNIDITNIFMPKLSAATLTSYDTYQKYWNQESGCGTSNKYSYTTYANNNPGNDLWEQATIGTRVYNKAAIMGFNFQYNLTANKYYDVVVNFATSDLSNSLNTTNVFVESGSSCQDFNKSYISLVGFSLSNSGTNYSNKATIRIFASSATTYWGFYFYKGVGQYVAGPNNFSVSSITIDEVQASDTDIIINNNTNNTNNIINNQNENTQQIIDSQNELLGSKCENLFDSSTISSGDIVGGTPTIRLSSRQSLYLSAGTYYFKTNLSIPYRYAISVNGVGAPPLSSYPSYIYDTGWNTDTSRSFTLSQGGYFVLLLSKSDNSSLIPADVSNFHFMLSSENKSYCEYGSFTSKLDDTTNAINDVNDSLNNDNVDSASNKATNFFNNFTDNDHGLSSIITMPLNSIRLMLSDNCVAPHTIYKGKIISFPCGDILWSRQGASALKDFLNIAYGGLICYYLIRSFFMWINRFKDPDNDKIEVIDL